MLKIILMMTFISQSFALEVIKPVYRSKIFLRIIRAEPASFESYNLTNHNGREMTLVCANNRFYGNKKKAVIQYRNFYGEIVADFEIESDQACREMGKFIENSNFGVDEARPFLITLSTKKHLVEKIQYPKLDPYADEGTMEDLLPKKRVFLQLQPKTKKAKQLELPH